MRAKAIRAYLAIFLLLASISTVAAQDDYEFEGYAGPSTAVDTTLPDGSIIEGFISVAPTPTSFVGRQVGITPLLFYPWSLFPPLRFGLGAGQFTLLLTANPPIATINIPEGQTVTFEVTAECPNSCNLGDKFKWQVDGREQIPRSVSGGVNPRVQTISGTTYKAIFDYTGAEGMRPVQVIVTDPTTGGQEIIEWADVIVSGTIAGKAVAIDVRQVGNVMPRDGDELAMGSQILFDPVITPELTSDANLVYIWDFGKRDKPWGRKTQLDACRPTGGSTDGSDDCDEFLALGDTENSFGNPCVCLGYEVPAFGAYNLDYEYYIYPDSIQVEASTEGGNNIRQRVVYDSPAQCNGWISTETVIGSNTPLYQDGPEISDGVYKSDACEVKLTVFNDINQRLEDSFWFELGSAENIPPTVGFRVDDRVSYNPNVPEFNTIQTTAGTQVTFASTSQDEDGTITAWVWDFGDGTSASQAEVTHDYQSAGTYIVTLTVFDNEAFPSTSGEFIVNVGAGLTAAISPSSVNIFQLDPEPDNPQPNEVSLGSQVRFRADAIAPREITEFIWDLGKRDKPWGEISRDTSCAEIATGGECSFYQALSPDREIGTPCVCNEDPNTGEDLTPYPYPEYNIYPESLVVDIPEGAGTQTASSRITSTYLSENECSDYDNEGDHLCTVSVTVKTVSPDGFESYSSLIVKNDAGNQILPASITIEGIPGDLVVDGVLDKCDRDLLYQVVTGEVVREDVGGDPDVDVNGLVNINDYVQLYDAVKGKPACGVVGDGGEETEEESV